LKNTDPEREYVAHLLECLKEESISCVDFDRLRSWLEQRLKEDIPDDSAMSQLQVLRDDYCARIGGMIKAIAAVRRGRDRWRDSCELIDSLPGMSAAGLVACYHKTSARFRDCFPASFGLLDLARKRSPRMKDVLDFK
jgi:hypothetical protein